MSGRHPIRIAGGLLVLALMLAACAVGAARAGGAAAALDSASVLADRQNGASRATGAGGRAGTGVTLRARGRLLAGTLGPIRHTMRLGKGREVAAGELVVRLRGERRERLLEVGPSAELRATLTELRADPDVAWAEPNAIARTSGVPNDPGRSGRPGGWVEDQWNFLTPPPRGEPCTAAAPCGVDAVGAWRLLRDAGIPYGQRPNGRGGPIIAVVDTGVAYRKRGKRFRRNPDFARASFVRGRDFVAGGRRPLDRNGHGTHVAATIVERTGNGRGVTGLAPGLRVMPVRVLDRRGQGRARDVAAGIRYAARKGARVINLSLEFDASYKGCKGLRVVCAAIRYAQRRGSLVVAAAGNLGLNRPQMPALVATGVAGSTIRGCLAASSSAGRAVKLTAPGGGSDRGGAGPQCDPWAPAGASPGIVQLTLRGQPPVPSFRRFGYPHYEGTSMAAAHVSAAAGLVLSARILHRRLGRRPGPADLEAWLQCTSRPLGDAQSSARYGAGLLDVGAALDPAGPCSA